MADISKFLPKLLKVEGNFVDDPSDAGGATNHGITLTTFRSYYGKAKTVNDLKSITDTQVEKIYKDLYWDKCMADDINSQSVAEMLVDFAVNSGCGTAIKKVQRLVRMTDDGKMTQDVVKAINSKRPQTLFNQLHDVRVAYFKQIVANKPSQKKFLNGWLNRLKNYTFES